MFFNFVYKKQNDNHKKRMLELKKKILSSNVSGEKKYVTSSAMLDINATSKKAKKVNQEKIEKIVQAYLTEPKKMFDYIKGAKTGVYIIKGAKKILSFIFLFSWSLFKAALNSEYDLKLSIGILNSFAKFSKAFNFP